MAILRSSIGNHTLHLPSRCLVGRSPHSDLALTDERVSWEHARLSWTGRAWELRDLASSNGTFIDGQRLSQGRAVDIHAGMALSFGHARDGWLVETVDPPTISARADDNGEVRVGEDGLLVLPSDNQPLLTIYRDLRGGWVAENHAGTLEVSDMGRVECAGRQWRVRLPDIAVSTLTMGKRAVMLQDLTFRFDVSKDEEQIALDILLEHDLLAHAESVYNYLLLTLARQRLADLELPEVLDSDRGWIYRDDLCRMLLLDNDQLNMHVFRARKLLSGKGVSGAAHLVERRPLTHQLRLGTSRVEIAQA